MTWLKDWFTNLTWDQMKGVVERLVGLGLLWAVARGLIDQQAAIDYGPYVVALISAIYAAWHNRPKSLVQRAAAVPGTAVVTTPELANSTPEMNIVSSATVDIVPTTADLNREEAARHMPG